MHKLVLAISLAIFAAVIAVNYWPEDKNILMSFDEKDIEEMGVWQHKDKALKARLFIYKKDFYIEIKTKQNSTVNKVAKKSPVKYHNLKNEDLWLIEGENFIQNRLKNKNLKPTDDRLVIFEKISKW